MAKPDISAELVRELFHYDEVTGVFTRRTSNRRWKAGSVAGSIDGDGYTLISVRGVQYRAHRLAWLYVHGAFPSADIDHRNGIRTDNRLANLRDVPRRQNLQNRHRTLAASGLLGAYRHQRSGLWRSAIRADGRSISLGFFKSPEEAHNAYVAARRRLYPDGGI